MKKPRHFTGIFLTLSFFMLGLSGQAALAQERIVEHIASVSFKNEFNLIQSSLDPAWRGKLVTSKGFPIGQTNSAGMFTGQTQAVTVADFNGDHLDDVAVCNFVGGTVDIFLRVDKPAQPVNFTQTNFTVLVNEPLYAIKSGDFNKDGLTDLVVLGFRGLAYIYLNDPQKKGESFIPAGNYVVGNQPSDCTVADFNKDGFLDIAVANFRQGEHALYLLKGKAGGLFDSAPLSVPVPSLNPETVIHEDINQDSWTDLVIDSSSFNGSPASIVILLNKEGQFLAERAHTLNIGTKDRIFSIVSGDFVDEGDFIDGGLKMPDLGVMTTQGANSNIFVVYLLPPNPGEDNRVPTPIINRFLWPGDFGAPQALIDDIFLGTTFLKMETSDFDGDGLLDLLASYQTLRLTDGPIAGAVILKARSNRSGIFEYFSHFATDFPVTRLAAYHDELTGLSCNNFEESEFCNDGIPCTLDICQDGQCVHTAQDEQCSVPIDDLSFTCRKAVCELNVGCQVKPDLAKNGVTCAPQDAFCTLSSFCSDGTCLVNAKVCSDRIDCTEDKCDEQAKTCRHTPKANRCRSFGEACKKVVCDPLNAPDPQQTACIVTVLPDGTSCNELACFDNEKCLKGFCAPGVAKDCSSFDTFCGRGVCLEGRDRGCVVEARNVGQSCPLKDPFEPNAPNSVAFCEVNAKCQTNATCSGTSRDCSDGVECTLDHCSEINKTCYHFPDHAQCPGGDGQCRLATCDVQKGCFVEKLPDGAWCKTDDFCFTSGHCQIDRCLPDVARCDDKIECTNDSCDAVARACVNTPAASCPAECADGKDNDNDGVIDTIDSGCRSTAWEDELNPEFSCNDGKDNNGDGKIDFRTTGDGDPRCITADDDDESVRETSLPLLNDSSVDTARAKSPVLGNLDEDPEFEIVMARSLSDGDTGEVFIYDSTGALLKEIDLVQDDGSYQYSLPVIEDIDGDNKNEILIHSSKGNKQGDSIFILNAQENIKKELPLPFASNFQIFNFAVGNVLNDEAKEIVVNSDQALAVLAFDGQVLWQKAEEGNLQGFGNSAILADMTGDDHMEVLMIAGRGLVIYDNQGQELAVINKSASESSVATADMDNDGDTDIVVSDGLGAYVVTREEVGGKTQFKESWAYTRLESGSVRDLIDRVGVGSTSLATGGLSQVGLGELDGDGKLDVVLVTRDVNRSFAFNILALSNLGHKLWDFKTSYKDFLMLPPVLVDLDSDHKMEIITQDSDISTRLSGRPQQSLILDNDGKFIDRFEDRTVLRGDLPKRGIIQLNAAAVGYLGDKERPGIVLSAVTEDDSIIEGSSIYILDHIKLPDAEVIPYPLWRMEGHDAQNSKRAGGCVTDADCYDGIAQTNEKCLKYTCQYEQRPTITFRRGDADGDGLVNINDPVRILRFLFQGEADPVCMDAADVDNSGGLSITDPIYILRYLFLGGPAPVEPFNSCGLDPAVPVDSLGCNNFPTCSGK